MNPVTRVEIYAGLLIAFLGCNLGAYLYGRHDEAEKWKAEKQAAEIAANAVHDERQGAITTQAETDNAEIAQRVTALTVSVDKLARAASAPRIVKVFPAGCLAAQVEVDRVNASR